MIFIDKSQIVVEVQQDTMSNIYIYKVKDRTIFNIHILWFVIVVSNDHDLFTVITGTSKQGQNPDDNCKRKIQLSE